MTINNADVYGKNNGNIANNTGTVTVNGGSFDLSGSASYHSVYGYNGDTFVEGGTFTKVVNGHVQVRIEVDEDNKDDPGSIAVAGGSFSAAVPEQYCAEGFIPEAHEVTEGGVTRTVYGVEPGWKVTFVNYDGTTVLFETNVAVGATAEYAGTTPNKVADANVVYTFSGWSPSVEAVTDAAQTYTATYSAVAALAQGFDANGDSVGFFASVNDAIEAAGDGCTVKLVANVTNQVYISSQKSPVALDLNGYCITNMSGSAINMSTGYYWNGDHVFTIRDSVGTGEIVAGPDLKYPGDACVSDNTGRTVIIESGTFKSSGKVVYDTASNGGMTILGGTFYGVVYVHDTGYGAGNVVISNGVFNGSLSCGGNGNAATIAVAGGSFSETVPSQYCAAGLAPTSIADANGMYTVRTARTVTFVAGDTTNLVIVASGEPVAEPQEPEKAGCEFSGWFADGAESAYVFETPVIQDLTLTAVWESASIAGTDGLREIGADEPTQSLLQITAIETAVAEAADCIGWKITFRPDLREGVETAAWLSATFASGRICVRHAAAVGALGGNGATVSRTEGELALESETVNGDGTISFVVPVESSATAPSSQFFQIEVE